jgi:hypothetical protein
VVKPVARVLIPLGYLHPGKGKHQEASVAKWLAHFPFTSEVAFSPQISVRTFSMRLEPSPHVKRVKINALPKVVGFLRVLRFPPTGKVGRVG